MDECIQFSLRDRRGEITIHREAQLNALDSGALEELSALLGRLEAMCEGGEAYETCRVVTIRGAGTKAFVAGADIKFMLHASPVELRRFIELGQRVMRQIELLPLPVIAVVTGFALGGGMELALACDTIVATERAKFGQAEVNLGVIPGFGGTQRLALRAGVGVARRMIFTGETIDAATAQMFGLVDWLIPSAELEVRLDEICQAIALKGPLAIAAAKRSIRSGLDGALVHGLGMEREEFLALLRTEDAREGLSAFIEKRKATFIGR